MPNDPKPAFKGFLLVLIFICLALGIAGVTLVLLWTSPEQAKTANASPIGGPFTLTSQTGSELSDTDLRGKPFAIFFGYTRCPEVCPTTLSETTQALTALGPDADKLKVLFVTVDPSRDTAEFMAEYLKAFDPRIIGLTGSEAELTKVAKEYKIFWKKVPTGDGDYTMDHTATMFLMNPRGEFVGAIDYGENMDTRLAKLRRLIAGDA